MFTVESSTTRCSSLANRFESKRVLDAPQLSHSFLSSVSRAPSINSSINSSITDTQTLITNVPLIRKHLTLLFFVYYKYRYIDPYALTTTNFLQRDKSKLHFTNLKKITCQVLRGQKLKTLYRRDL